MTFPNFHSKQHKEETTTFGERNEEIKSPSPAEEFSIFTRTIQTGFPSPKDRMLSAEDTPSQSPVTFHCVLKVPEIHVQLFGYLTTRDLMKVQSTSHLLYNAVRIYADEILMQLPQVIPKDIRKPDFQFWEDAMSFFFFTIGILRPVPRLSKVPGILQFIRRWTSHPKRTEFDITVNYSCDALEPDMIQVTEREIPLRTNYRSLQQKRSPEDLVGGKVKDLSLQQFFKVLLDEKNIDIRRDELFQSSPLIEDANKLLFLVSSFLLTFAEFQNCKIFCRRVEWYSVIRREPLVQHKIWYQIHLKMDNPKSSAAGMKFYFTIADHFEWKGQSEAESPSSRGGPQPVA